MFTTTTDFVTFDFPRMTTILDKSGIEKKKHHGMPNWRQITKENFHLFNNNNDHEGISKKYNITATLSAQVSAQVSDVCECCICMNDEINCVDSVMLNCEHQFCGDCIISTLKKHNKSSDLKPSCALCRTTMTEIVTNNSEVLAKIQEFCV